MDSKYLQSDKYSLRNILYHHLCSVTVGILICTENYCVISITTHVTRMANDKIILSVAQK